MWALCCKGGSVKVSILGFVLLMFTALVNSAELTLKAQNELNSIKLGNNTVLSQVTYKANFASNFEIVEWGCGAPCTESVIINLISGDIVKFINSCYGLAFSVVSNKVAFINIPNDPTTSCINTQKLELIDGNVVKAT